jgi:hypothetical protein
MLRRFFPWFVTNGLQSFRSHSGGLRLLRPLLWSPPLPWAHLHCPPRPRLLWRFFCGHMLSWGKVPPGSPLRSGCCGWTSQRGRCTSSIRRYNLSYGLPPCPLLMRFEQTGARSSVSKPPLGRIGCALPTPDGRYLLAADNSLILTGVAEVSNSNVGSVFAYSHNDFCCSEAAALCGPCDSVARYRTRRQEGMVLVSPLSVIRLALLCW